MNQTKPANALKVFGVRVLRASHFPGSLSQPSLVVAATSRAAAARLMSATGTKVTASFLKTYGSETKNPAQVEAALSAPGTVFCAITDSSAADTYAPLHPRRTP